MPESYRLAIRGLVAGQKPWPLFVAGGPGTGKTCGALALLDHTGGMYFTLRGLCKQLVEIQKGRICYESGRQVSENAFWEEFSRCTLVVIDEVGTRTVSDHAYEVFLEAISTREGKPLVVISNVDIQVITRVYDDRIASRLAAGTVLYLQGQDQRLRR